MQGWRQPQPSRTNRPSSYPSHPRGRSACAWRVQLNSGRVQDIRSGELAVRPPGHAETPTAWEAFSSSSTSAAHRSAAMAGGARPDPFRTRKLSRRAPMVLRGQPVGEQGAADRWTALDPHPAGPGAGAPRGCPAAPPSFFPYALAGPSGALFSWGESPRLWNRIIRLFVCGLDEPSDTRGRVAPFLWRAFLALRDPLGEKAFVLSGAEGPCSRIRALAAAYRLGWSIHLRKRCPAVRSVYGPFRFRRAILPRSRASFIVDPWLRRLNGIPERVFQAA